MLLPRQSTFPVELFPARPKPPNSSRYFASLPCTISMESRCRTNGTSVICKISTVQGKYHQTRFSPFLLLQPVSTFPNSTPPHRPKRPPTTPTESSAFCASFGTLRIPDGATRVLLRFQLVTASNKGVSVGAGYVLHGNRIPDKRRRPRRT